MTALATNAPEAVVDRIKTEIDQWRRNPADPHRIARVRTSAYQKAIVFKYLDNLIAWGDSLFARNTMESINQATQLYMLASHLLGPRPQHVPQKVDVPAFCYDDLRGDLDELSDTIESALHPEASKSAFHVEAVSHSLLSAGQLPVIFPSQIADPGMPQVPLVFCVPPNGKLLGYFDTVDDRLFKIRNCMNIQGVVQQLPLFQPPIDPALLVRAAALGLDIGSILIGSQLTAAVAAVRDDARQGQRAVQRGAARSATSCSRRSRSRMPRDSRSCAPPRRPRCSPPSATSRSSRSRTPRSPARRSRKRARSPRQKSTYYDTRQYMNARESTQIASMQRGLSLQTIAGITFEAASQGYVAGAFEVGPTGMGVHAAWDFGTVNLSRCSRWRWARRSRSHPKKTMAPARSPAFRGASIAGRTNGTSRRTSRSESSLRLTSRSSPPTSGSPSRTGAGQPAAPDRQRAEDRGHPARPSTRTPSCISG